MADATTELARGVRSLFRAMNLAADGGKEKFGDWVYKVVDKLTPYIARIFASSLKSFGGTVDKDEVALTARQRALETARSICDTTNIWLMEGRDESFIFSSNRAAGIAVTEAAWAINTAKLVACRQQGMKSEWVLGRKPCKHCLKFAGKRVTPGKTFGTHDGKPVFAPPLHPSCYCRLKSVKASK